jgi:hypothetical protein
LATLLAIRNLALEADLKAREANRPPYLDDFFAIATAIKIVHNGVFTAST